MENILHNIIVPELFILFHVLCDYVIMTVIYVTNNVTSCYREYVIVMIVIYNFFNSTIYYMRHDSRPW